MTDSNAELAQVRADLRVEIGPPTDRDRRWQPMASAHEVRVLLDALDMILPPAQPTQRGTTP